MPIAFSGLAASQEYTVSAIAGRNTVDMTVTVGTGAAQALVNDGQVYTWSVTTDASGNLSFNKTGAKGNDLHAMSLTLVPEPGSLALLGLGGLCVLRRRRN